MNLLPLALLQLFSFVIVLLSFVQSTQPTTLLNPLSLKDQIIRKFPQVGLNPKYPNHFEELPELCFVIARIAFKSMSLLNEKLDIKDLKDYSSSYFGENYSDINNESYEDLLKKPILFNLQRNILSNVLTKLTFLELLNSNLMECSIELILIIRIIELLAECDNGIGYLISRIYLLNLKVDLALLAQAISHGQVICSKDFLDVINEFGKHSVENW
jgi:hypothetical protein